ncbi:DUF3987 domain-containing protein [Pseudomonadota bacterium]
MSNLNAALALAGKGKPIFPCNNRKQPIIKTGFKAATADSGQVTTWWSQCPDALIGMPTGACSGTVVLDVDNKDGRHGDETLFQLQREYGQLPNTVEVLTPSGGRHLYFTHPGETVKNSVDSLGIGLDIRGDGGYVIVPPSRIDGRGYEWEASSPNTLADMPEWLLDLIRPPKETKSQTFDRKSALDGVPEGQRDDTLYRYACGLQAKGNTQAEAEALVKQAAAACEPPFDEAIVLEKVERVYQQYGNEWPDIIPLPERGDMGEAQPYRLDLLPSAIQKAAGEVARFSMVPEASPTVIGLSVLAAAIGKKAVIVERNGLEHYPALFFALIAHSGERKSPAFKTMSYPLEQWAEDQKTDYEERVRKAKARNAAIDNEISTVKGKAKKDGSGIDFVTDELSRLEAERIQPPPFPSLFTTDTTEQRLFQKMHDRGGAYAVMSGEGRPVLDAIMGKYSGDGRTGDAVYLAGISGDTITRDRVGGDNGPEERVIARPCLNVCVMVQQGKYMEAASVPALRDSGALARIWPVWLPAKAGTRIEQEDDEGLNTGLLKPFNCMVRDVLDHEAQRDEQGRTIPHRACLSAEAVKARREFHNYIEQLMGEGEDLEDVRDIASKAVSQTCKLALVLHIAENHSVLNEPVSTISAKTWAVAQTLGAYHLTEAVRVQRLADEDASLESARRVVWWIKKERLVEVTTTRLTQQGPRPRLKAAQAREVLSLLEDHGYLKTRRIPGKRKPVYDVNPALFSQSSQFSRG